MTEKEKGKQTEAKTTKTDTTKKEEKKVETRKEEPKVKVEAEAKKQEKAEVKKDEKKGVQDLASELGLDPKQLEDEGIELAQAEEEQAPKKKKSKKETKRAKRVADLTKENEIGGFPVNHLSKPIEYDEQGNPKELTVTFDQEEVEQYRETNGRVLLRIYHAKYKRRGGDTLEVITQYKDGKEEKIVTTNNHSRGWKRAKTWAMLLKLAFNPDKDVESIQKGEEQSEAKEKEKVTS